MTSRTPWFALLCMTLAAPLPDIGAASPGVLPNVNESLISEMTQVLLSSQVVTLEHHIDYKVPAPFATTRPCHLRRRGGSFEKKLGRDSVNPFATALGVSQLLADARGFRGAPCRGDSVRTDVVTMTFGKGKKAVRARIILDEGMTTFSWGDSTPAVVSLGTKSENVRQLLMHSMPEDSLLRGIPPCDRTVPEDLDVPALGTFVWVDSLPEAIERVPPIYPQRAQSKGVDGQVMIQALISKTGTVVSTIIIHSIPALDEAAVHAVEGWRFRPAMTGGAPVAVWVMIPVKFTLR